MWSSYEFYLKRTKQNRGKRINIIYFYIYTHYTVLYYIIKVEIKNCDCVKWLYQNAEIF